MLLCISILAQIAEQLEFSTLFPNTPSLNRTPNSGVTPVTAHLVVSPPDIPPDWRLEEVAGKLRYHWKDFARTCGFDSEVVDDIDSVSLLLSTKKL